MPAPLKLGKYSLGVGDRFGQQAQAQLRACMQAEQAGVLVIPVWNKSQREHAIIGSEPASTRQAADAAVQALGWKHHYHVDADHIKLPTVTPFLPHCDYFTLDVGDAINGPVSPDAIETFVARHPELLGWLEVPGIEEPFRFESAELRSAVRTFFPAVIEAGALYRRILHSKGGGGFITEISMDETASPQSPRDLLLILAALADEGVRVQTVAPKFTGRFNKGVEYVGDRSLFARQFREDLLVIAFAVSRYDLPADLKLSVHSGSDKFSLYPAISAVLVQLDAGLHLKTAGTTWLQELAGLASADSEGFDMVKRIYCETLKRIDEICEPYGNVIAIDPAKLPSEEEVAKWQPSQLVAALVPGSSNPFYNPDLRQLLHVGYKIAAEMGGRYLGALQRHRDRIGEKVTANLYEGHLKPLFCNSQSSRPNA